MDRFGKIIAEMAADGYRLPSWISFTGRIRRREFFLRAVVLGLEIAALIAAFFYFFQPESCGDAWFAFKTHLAWCLPGLAVFGGLLWLLASAMTLRFHDLGFSAWMFLVLLIPFLNLFIFVMLVLGDGDMPNRFGWPPPSNRKQTLPGN